MNTQALSRITKPIHRKGSTEEHIFAENTRAKTTAKLMAELMAAKQADTSPEMRQVLAELAGRQA